MSIVDIDGTIGNDDVGLDIYFEENERGKENRKKHKNKGFEIQKRCFELIKTSLL